VESINNRKPKTRLRGRHLKRSRAAIREANALRVINAALDLYASTAPEDPSEITMRDVAESAEINISEIYRLFESKEQLLSALADHKLKEMLVRLKEHLEGVEGMENRIRKFTWCILDWLDKNRGFVSFIVTWPIKIQEDESPNNVMREQASVFMDIIGEGQEEGKVRPDVNKSMLTKMYFGGIERLAYVSVYRGSEQPLTSYTNTITDIVTRAIEQR